jgi:hypothetical protein
MRFGDFRRNVIRRLADNSQVVNYRVHDFFIGLKRVPGEFQICRHLRPRVQDELSQSFGFPIFKRGNQIETGLFKGERVNPTR